MAVYRLDIAYDGGGFRGYARQEGQRTIQGELESALATILGQTVETAVAGRTDAGVHALGQVVSVRVAAGADPGKLQKSLNGILGPEVSITDVSAADDEFHARFSAIWRRYLYRLDTRPGPNPLERGFVWHVGRQLDLPAMSSAAQQLLGEHDFSSFCRSIEGKGNVRHLTELTLEARDGEVEAWFRANAFCQQMVRSIVGYLYDVGRGFCDAAQTLEVIEARDRGRVATVAPAHGLTLYEVGYP